MGNYSKFYDGDMSKLATVIAFDPGETTGYTLMGIRPDYLSSLGSEDLGAFQDRISHIEYGQIDCQVGDGTGFDKSIYNHPGLNFDAENQGVTEMLKICEKNQAAAIVFEDFILDFSQATKARHTLSPVRITSAFSYGLWRDRLDNSLPQAPMFVQQRALAKTTCTDTRLRHWGLHDTHSGPHARDATRHAYYFLRNCRGAGEKAAENRWRAWPHLFADPVAQAISDNPRVIVKRREGERVRFK